MKVTQQTKTCSKSFKKERFSYVTWVSLYHVFSVVVVFCKMNMFLLSSLASMIIDSVSRWVGGRWVSGRWSVGCWVSGPWIQQNPEKNMFGVKISLLYFGRDLFCCSNFIFFHVNGIPKVNLTARSSHSNLLFLMIHKYYNFKQNKARVYWNFIKYSFHYIRSCCKRSEKASALLKNSPW